MDKSEIYFNSQRANAWSRISLGSILKQSLASKDVFALRSYWAAFTIHESLLPRRIRRSRRRPVAAFVFAALFFLVALSLDFAAFSEVATSVFFGSSLLMPTMMIPMTEGMMQMSNFLSYGSSSYVEMDANGSKQELSNETAVSDLRLCPSSTIGTSDIW
ncbi:hypothetical protein M5K25_027780 [Dendrobium thyrsiflorum]|uniref:Uncharacterized protein n=1 Tax=Dendrobium thyrsiflorum TaxID=117978 RepID=A0ABD0TV36_DENTH